jgi:hypothetical protein
MKTSNDEGSRLLKAFLATAAKVERALPAIADGTGDEHATRKLIDRLYDKSNDLRAYDAFGPEGVRAGEERLSKVGGLLRRWVEARDAGNDARRTKRDAELAAARRLERERLAGMSEYEREIAIMRR